MTVTIKISINGLPTDTVIGNIEHSEGMNVQSAMELGFRNGQWSKLGFAMEYYGATLGYEVVRIGTFANEADFGCYVFWALSVNGEISNTGIDSTILADGDEIEWNYEVFQPSKHEGGRHDEIRRAR